MSRGMRGVTGALAAAMMSLLWGAAPVAAAQEGGYGSSARLETPFAATSGPPEEPYSEFLKQVDQSQVRSVNIAGQEIRGEFQGGKSFVTESPVVEQSTLVERLMRHGVEINAEKSGGSRGLDGIETFLMVVVVLIGVVAYFELRQRQQSGSGARGTDMSGFAKSRARRFEGGEVGVTFQDAAGIEEAKQEVMEIVEFLKDPAKFSKLGGRIPKGVLMVGAPGTGKTLLARAIAGEAKVPFFSASGSDFVEMFVGIGAARVRDLFAQARQLFPCIVFIDEIDALGRHRGGGGGGGNEEREQTLNQLLVEMDGFQGTEGVIVIAATNRPDVLDPALLRPGRFDRQVVVPLPDVTGRERILRLHLTRVPLAEDVRPALIARGTPGFSGAELASLVNEAALFAARADKSAVGMEELERAKDKIMLGVERHSLRMSDQERRLTAFHEGGHAIVGLHVPDHDPLYKVSILPRGRALGLTVYLPETDRHSQSKQALQSRICALLGGRIAEELIFGPEQVTTGAANDLERATEIARAMVTEYGMSDALGPLAYGAATAAPDRLSGSGASAGISADTARAIDAAVRGIVEVNYARAREILETHETDLRRLAEALIERETLDSEEIEEVLRSRAPCGPAHCDNQDRVVAVAP